jgi:hypothetical protein
MVVIPGAVRITISGGRVSRVEETGEGNGAVSTTIGMKEQTTHCIYIKNRKQFRNVCQRKILIVKK